MNIDSRFVIRKGKVSEEKIILSLLNEAFLIQERNRHKRDQSFFKWKFLESPFGESILTIAEYQGEVIGFDHLWPWQLSYKDKQIFSYQGCDSVVKKEFRGNRIMQYMRAFGIEEARNKNADLLFNFPNNQSLKTNLNYGYSYTQRIKWWVKIINIYNLIALLTKRTKNHLINIPITPLSISELNYISKLHKEFSPRNLITINRSQGYFEYRYVNHPSRKYFSESIDKEICGIYTINNNNGIGELVITEIIGNTNLTKKLLNRITIIAKKLNCAYITIMDDNYQLNNSLILQGFIPKKLKNMVVYPLNPKLNLAINYKEWNITASLHDSI